MVWDLNDIRQRIEGKKKEIEKLRATESNPFSWDLQPLSHKNSREYFRGQITLAEKDLELLYEEYKLALALRRSGESNAPVHVQSGPWSWKGTDEQRRNLLEELEQAQYIDKMSKGERQRVYTRCIVLAGEEAESKATRLQATQPFLIVWRRENTALYELAASLSEKRLVQALPDLADATCNCFLNRYSARLKPRDVRAKISLGSGRTEVKSDIARIIRTVIGPSSGASK